MIGSGKMIIALVLAGSLGPLGGAAHRRTEEGNRSYEAEEYEEALRAYTKAQVDLPEAPELFYDIGNVLYRQGDLAGAEESWMQAMKEADRNLLADIGHNLGNARYQRQAYQEAAEAYRQALALRPDDRETKRNLELALRRLEVQQQEQQQDPQSGDEKEQEQDRPPESGPESKPPEDGKEQKSPDEEPSPGEMTREEAERLMDSLEAEEKENLKAEEARKMAAAGGGREKDW